jgi:hypothetical protein
VIWRTSVKLADLRGKWSCSIFGCGGWEAWRRNLPLCRRLRRLCAAEF